MCHGVGRGKKNGFFVAEDCHPQTISVIETRAKPLGIELHIGPVDSIDFDGRQSGTPDLSHAWAPPPALPVHTFLPTKPAEDVPAHAPPPTASGPPIFLRNCSFLK